MFAIIITTTLFFSAMSARLPIVDSVRSSLITFDDITNSTDTPGIPIPNGYHGLNWQNVQVLDGDTFGNSGTGYTAGVVSHPYLAFDPYGGSMGITSANGSTFTFNSFYSCAVWYDNAVTLEIVGSKSGNVLHTKSLILSMQNRTFIELNWSGVDNVYLNSSCFICCDAKHFTMDNLSITFEK